MVIPNTYEFVAAKIREMGMDYHLSRDLPKNKLFYTVHPDDLAVLRGIEEKLGLTSDKLRTSRHVLSEYGNMGSSSVLFVLDELRRKSMDEGKSTTDDGGELGVLLGFESGLTVEMVGLRSFALNSAD
ncbi:chalcone synthase RJ5-like [Hibiscus syriacus]|uniref:chalcone synthase RJ5-like n=1 Tax=Hibiscus syriacus TaxID=106335 RepID=UPI001920D4BE|nr:chalcone synthase RJ5-like [Hibiscus syriacus]